MCGTQLLQGIFTKQNCLLPTALWKRNSSKGKEENGLKSCFHRRGLSGFVHFSISWCCCQELGAKLGVENISVQLVPGVVSGQGKPLLSGSRIWAIGRGNRLVGNLHVMGRQTAQHWHVPLGGIFIQLYNANFCRWLGVCFILGKEIKCETRGWIKRGLESIAGERLSKRPNAGCSHLLAQSGFWGWMYLKHPGRNWSDVPLAPHEKHGWRDVAGPGGRSHPLHQSMQPLWPSASSSWWWPLPRPLTFPTGGVWVVSSHAGHFGGCVTVRWWGKESLAGSMVQKSQPVALLLHLLPIQLLVAQQPVLFQGPRPSPWGWLMAAREGAAVPPCKGRSYSRGERGRREVGSTRVSQEVFFHHRYPFL